MPGLLKWQMLIAILASPLLVFAVYQSGNTLAIMSRDVLTYAKDFVQFAFFFPTRYSTAGFAPFAPSFPFNL